MTMTTPQRPSIWTHDALKHLSGEPGEGSNELFAALSIASARFEASGVKLDRLTGQLSLSPQPKPFESLAIAPTP